MVAADAMFVRGLAFLASVLQGIKFTTVEYMTKHMAPVISKYLEKFYDNYLKRGFTVYLFLMDCEFECLRDKIPGYSDLSTTAEK